MHGGVRVDVAVDSRARVVQIRHELSAVSSTVVVLGGDMGCSLTNEY
jgi:hypothetical protein